MIFWNLAPALQNLGWALLDSLWQMGLVWLIYTAITANGRKFSARVRQQLAIFSLTGGSLLFLINAVILFSSQSSETGSVLNSLFRKSNWFLVFTTENADALISWLSAAYLLSISYLFLRLCRQFFYSRRLTHDGLDKIQPRIRLFTRELAARIGIKKKVQIAISQLIDTPLTIGFWKPIILLPIAAINNLSTSQVEAIIIHELYHIRHNDYLLNVFLSITEIVFFFNPFTRMLANSVRKERENACDDNVLQFRYDAMQYATALLILEQNRHAEIPQLALSSAGSSKHYLLNRIKRLLGMQPARESWGFKQVSLLAAAFMVACFGWLHQIELNPMKQVQLAGNSGFAVPAASFYKTPMAVAEVIFTASLAPAPKKQGKNIRIKKAGNLNYPDGWSKELEAALTAYYENQNEIASASHGTFANNATPIEFSMQEAETRLVPEEAALAATAPYVPSNSFSFLLMEDTTVPKVYRPSESELKAKESLNKTMKALDEVNWSKLEKELSSGNKKTDIVKLQAELKKALEELNWRKINEEIQREEDEIKFKENYQQRFESYLKQQQDKEAQLKKLQQQILNDRLLQQKDQNCPEKKREKTTTKVKKIVVI